MLSLVLFIASCFVLVGGIAYFIYKYAPWIVDTITSFFDAFQTISDFVPSFLAPYLAILVALAVLGLLIKVL